MVDNNMMIMLGLGAAALWFMNRGGSEEDQAGQLTGAAMMASGEGTNPDQPFQGFSASDAATWFNMGRSIIPGTNVPVGASPGEDIGVYPGGAKVPELEFTVARGSGGTTPAGTSDISPGNPLFGGAKFGSVTAASIWDEQSEIAAANFMPLLALQNQDQGFSGYKGFDIGGGVDIIGANVDIATLSSKEKFRATNLESPGAVSSGFTTSAAVLTEYVQGFKPFSYTPSPGPSVVVSQTTGPAATGGNNWLGDVFY
jgi:hypothetical protein